MQKLLLSFLLVSFSLTSLSAEDTKDWGKMSDDEFITAFKKIDKKAKKKRKETEALKKIRQALEKAKNQKTTKK